MNDELVDRCKTYAKYGQRPLPSWARAAFRDCVHRIEALTVQLAEARESERAAVVAWLRGGAGIGASLAHPSVIAAIEAGEHD